MMKQKEVTMSKRAQAIEVIKSNSHLTPDAIVALISDKINVNLSGAKSYYRYIIKHGLATGEALTRKKAAKKTKEVKGKRQIDKLLGSGVVTLTERGNEAIKAANLAKMKEVAKRKDYGKRVSQAVEVEDPDFDPKLARDEVDRMLDERDEIKGIVPKFLHKELGLI
jgi:hypothetical protein